MDTWKRCLKKKGASHIESFNAPYMISSQIIPFLLSSSEGSTLLRRIDRRFRRRRRVK
jgi:hypothetical protein